MADRRESLYSGLEVNAGKERLMTKSAMIVFLASLLPLTAAAQAAKPEAKPQAAKPAVVVADGEKKSRRSGDARHCLEKSSNVEIIKCAEAYL